MPSAASSVEITVARLFEHRQLASQVQELQEALDTRGVQDRIVGQSGAMQGVFKTIGRVANSDSTVLIMGETGTGKELIADTIQANSRRRRGPLPRALSERDRSVLRGVPRALRTERLLRARRCAAGS